MDSDEKMGSSKRPALAAPEAPKDISKATTESTGKSVEHPAVPEEPQVLRQEAPASTAPKDPTMSTQEGQTRKRDGQHSSSSPTAQADRIFQKAFHLQEQKALTRETKAALERLGQVTNRASLKTLLRRLCNHFPAAACELWEQVNAWHATAAAVPSEGAPEASAPATAERFDCSGVSTNDGASDGDSDQGHVVRRRTTRHQRRKRTAPSDSS